MDQPYFFEIRVDGHLSSRWSDWFEGLAVHADPNGGTTLSGCLADQAALYGVLAKIHALNLALVSVSRFPMTPPDM
jgi:hypothetical protein